MDEKDVARLRHCFSCGDASERIPRGSISAARARSDVKGPAGDRHDGHRAGRGGARHHVVAAIGIDERQPDVVRRVRVKEQNAAREHVRAVVVDSYERQCGTPGGGAGQAILDRRRGVVVGVAGQVPLDPDRREGRVRANRAGHGAIRLRGEYRGPEPAHGDRHGGQRRHDETDAARHGGGGAVREIRHSAHEVCRGFGGRAATEVPRTVPVRRHDTCR